MEYTALSEMRKDRQQEHGLLLVVRTEARQSELRTVAGKGKEQSNEDIHRNDIDAHQHHACRQRVSACTDNTCSNQRMADERNDHQ